MRYLQPIFGVVVALAIASAAGAQVQTGSIFVKAIDEQNAALPGATITITSPVLASASMTGTTDVGGLYRFPSLTPGVYLVKVELTGFQTVNRPDVVVQVGQSVPVDVTMKVGTVQESITVSGAAPTIDTTSATVNVTLSQQLLQATPGGRDIWSLTEYKVPGLVMSRPDVGGTSGGLQGTYTARGTTSQQNSQFLNGVNEGDVAGLGGAAFYFDYDAFDEIQVSVGAHDITVPTGGVFLNMITKSGTDRWLGQTAYYYEGKSTQSGNVDSTLQNFGFNPITGAVNVVSDATFQIGGPIVKGLRLFTALRDWRVHVNTPAALSETLIDETNMTSGLLNLTYQLNDKNKFTALYMRQYYKKPSRFLTSVTVPSTNFESHSVSNEDDRFDVAQGLWNSIFTPQFFMDARFNFLTADPFALKFNGTQQPLNDLSTGVLLNNPSTQSINTRNRWGANATFNYYLDRALGGRHELKFGFDYTHATAVAETDRWGDVSLSYRSQPSGTTPAGASTVTLFNTPVIPKSDADVLSLFLQDSYIVHRLTLTGGLRYERLWSYLPEQSSPPTQWGAAGIGGFASLPRSFGASGNIVQWTNVGPRVNAVIDVAGDAKTAIKASAARYYYVLSASAVNAVNLNATYSEQYNWKDANGDLQFQPGEQVGTPIITSATSTSFSPTYARPYTNEFTLGVDRELPGAVRLSTVATYRSEKAPTAYLNTAAPFNVWPTRAGTDPGPDGRTGTADDTPVTYFNRTVAATQILVNNDPTFTQTYKGVEITATKRMSSRWQMLAGLTLSRSRQDDLSEAQSTGALSAGPNTLTNTNGPISTDVPVQFKLTGSYMLPHDVSLAANFRSQSGTPYNRQLSVPLTLGGSTTINVEPFDSDRVPALTTLDLQVSKLFRVRGGSFNVLFAVSNVTNANTVWSVRTLTGLSTFRIGGDPTAPTNVVSQFGTPTNILGPRIARVGVTYRF